MHNILILGPGKTGTTAVYDRVKQALNAEETGHYYLFEPTTPRPFDALRAMAPDRPIMTKVVLNREHGCELRYDDFDKKVMIVRDPRDVLISRLLFRPLIRSAVHGGDGVDAFLEALREKEADPRSWSLRRLSEYADELGISSSAWRAWQRLMLRQIELDGEHDFFSSRYEKFVVGDIDELSDYLDLELGRDNRETSGWLSHIARSLGAGEWRHWFTAEDVEFFRPMLSEFTDYYGYTDWQLAPEPSIDPANASGYIERKLDGRKSQVAIRYEDLPATDLTESDIEPLRAMADDGDAGAAVRLATILHDEDFVGHDSREAKVVAHHAALQGSTEAMQLLERWGDGIESGYWSAQRAFWSETPAADTDDANAPAVDEVIIKNRTPRQWYNEARRLRGRVNQLEASTDLAVGRAMVRAVRSPGRDTVALPKRLWRIYRDRRVPAERPQVT